MKTLTRMIRNAFGELFASRGSMKKEGFIKVRRLNCNDEVETLYIKKMPMQSISSNY